jgi:hypothetical protein
VTQKQALTSNGDDAQEVRDQLDQIGKVLDSSDANELLERVNAGLGNYDDGVLFQQEESYRKGLIAHTAFSSMLTKRIIDETKRYLAQNGIKFYDKEGQKPEWHKPIDKAEEFVEGEKQSSWNAEREYGDQIWQDIGESERAITEKQVAAMIKATGIEPGGWMPLFWDMLIGKHEMSRSLDAELIRLYLGDHYTVDDQSEAEGTTNALLRRR